MKRLLIFSLVVVAGCSTSPDSNSLRSVKPLQKDSLFLRGVFNWWGSPAHHQFAKRDDGRWTATALLDGTNDPYDFKLSNKDWLQSQTCGTGSTLPVSPPFSIDLLCGSNANNIKLMVLEDGRYEFELMEQGRNGYSLKVKAVQ